VCPTGVDIRNGPNLGCIQCGLCIDACDAVMAKIGQPARLIAYDTELNVKLRQDGKAPIIRIVRPRTLLYAAVTAIVSGVMLYTIATRASEGISVIHDRNPMYVRLADGAVRNAYTVRILNMSPEPRKYGLSIEGMAGAHIEVIGASSNSADAPVVEVGADQTRELRILVTTREPLPPAESIPITFHIVDMTDGTKASAVDHFRGP
jgi:polyferredoxin